MIPMVKVWWLICFEDGQNGLGMVTLNMAITARLSNANDFPGKKKFFNEILEPNYISPVVSVC